MEILISIAGQVVGWKSRVSLILEMEDLMGTVHGRKCHLWANGTLNLYEDKWQEGRDVRAFGEIRRMETNETMRLLGTVPSWISWIFDSFQVMWNNIMLSLIQSLIIVDNFFYFK